MNLHHGAHRGASTRPSNGTSPSGGDSGVSLSAQSFQTRAHQGNTGSAALTGPSVNLVSTKARISFVGHAYRAPYAGRPGRSLSETTRVRWPTTLPSTRTGLPEKPPTFSASPAAT